MKNVKKIVIYAVVAIAVIGAIVGVRKFTAAKKNVTTAVSVSKTAVEVQDVKVVDKNSGDTYKATMEAHQQGIITSKVSAKVVSVSIENGQYVNTGDTIATLDDQDIQNNIKSAQAQLQTYQTQLNSSQAALEKYKINVDDAQRNYDRQKALFDQKAISQTDIEAAEKTLNSAKADYNSGLASIETAKANIASQSVTISNYQDNLKNTSIKAPISGVISDKSLIIGQMASQGSTLAKINDISSVNATIQVPQEKINTIKIGQAATVKVDGNDTEYNGIVQNIDLSADTSARVFNCKIKIDNSDKTLFPGVFAKVELISGEKAEMVTVPINALVGSEGNYSVFINDNGKAKKQKVTIGETDENNVEITSGVQNGDKVICSNTGSLQDGDEIDVVS
ncbi:efflux RND transporter periplasmic adaptor subunit [Clostridium chromiireducens]|uniref:Efflux RND transporter periplasmic adaptor subunit n=1 Tax=Clostridium chromiireducens TaxID=225345 RepID=A0A964RL39_9CLOT|nr:efflux RND transporter periplasmic adaptor subunit [Clostridium chromiireducens]MVX63450.1 efflux RND transporter periplasmic adaptor subunit [Clostridium chromiireducens]